MTLDTAPFAITSELQALFGKTWDVFCDIAAQAFVTLREHFEELLEYTRLVFAYLYEANDIEQFLQRQLRMHDSKEGARRYIREQIKKAPHKLKTKLKNRMHAIAQYSTS